MKWSYLLLLFQLAAPSNLSVAVAAIKQELPECALGNGYTGYNGHTAVRNSGCPGADHLVSTSTGFAGHFVDFRLAGNLVSVADVEADGGSEVEIVSSYDRNSGQGAFNATLDSGANNVWILAKVPAGATGLRIHTSAIQNTNWNVGTLYTLAPSATYAWQKLPGTIASAGSKQTFYFIPEPGLKLACVYADLSAGANPQCDTGTIPQVPDYIVLDTNGSPPADESAAIWAAANPVPLTGFNSGTIGTHTVRALWDSTTNKIYVLGTITGVTLQTNTTADDDVLIGNDSAVFFDFRADQQLLKDTATYRTVINYAATPAFLDATWGPFSTTPDLTNVAKDQTTGKVMLTFTAPWSITDNEIVRGNFISAELVGGIYAWRESFTTAGLQDGLPTGLVQFSSTVATLPPDTTAPTLGIPSLVSNGTNQQTWTFSCTDVGTDCVTLFLDWDTGSGVPYANTQSCNVSGPIPVYTATCVLTGLTSNTAIFVRGRDAGPNAVCTQSTTGAGCGAENNGTTSSSTGFYIATGTTFCGGSGICTGTKATTSCTDVSAATRCPISQLSAAGVVQHGETWFLKDGLYGTSGITLNCNAGVFSGQPGNPITIQAENERLAYISYTGGAFGSPNLSLIGCHDYVISGIRFSRNIQPSNLYGIVTLTSSSNITVRRLLLHDCDHSVTLANGGNTHCVGIQGDSDNNLIVENECYLTERYCFFVSSSQSSGNIFRRNYCNSRDWAHSAGACVSWYPGSNNIAENNIAENMSGVFSLSKFITPSNVNNQAFGNIVFNGGGIFEACGQSTTQMPQGFVAKDNVVKSNRTDGESSFALSGSDQSTWDNNSSWQRAGNHGMAVAFIGDSAPDFCPELISAQVMTGKNNLIVSTTAGTGFLMAGTWSLQASNAQGNSTNYNPTSGDSRYNGYAHTDTPTAAQLLCPAFIILGSTNLKGAGVGGADIGANVDYIYVKGVKQAAIAANKFWNSATREVNPAFVGVTIAGLNVSDGLSTFGARFHPSCSLANFP